MKMLLKRNILENITIVSNSVTLFCISLHYLTDISLITGKWFLLYIITVFILSVFLSFRIIQWLLGLNKPLSYDLDGIVAKYPYLAPLRSFLPELPKAVEQEWKEYDTNELSVISTVLERKLVSSWYVPYISQEIGFPFACKQMLDQMIGRAFQICSNIETKDVFVDISTILISHLKEYEKAVKRHEKTPSSSINSLYKTTHKISDPDKKYTSADHCTNIIRIMIKELLPWELRDTPHSEMLVRILSKKLDSFIDSTLADPAWLNDRLVTYLTGEEYKDTPKEDKEEIPTAEESKSETVKDTDTPKEEPKKEVVEEEKVGQVIEECEGKKETVAEVEVPDVDVTSSPVLRQRRGRQGRSEVKIYDRIIEGSTKTWETDMDLQCISLGQDLLASLDGEITLSRLWGQEDHDHSPTAGKKTHTAAEEADPQGHSPRLSPKPGTEALHALQASVSVAKHRIGDLQVNHIDGGASDEAAGMMEGLLDFGIAGLRKGLRFTGLSDDSQEKSPSHLKDRADKSPPLEWSKQIPDAPIEKEENGNGIPHLVKQHRVTSQDSVLNAPRSTTPTGAQAESGGASSPEPQYEEAADLSASIAKLRRLLRQRADGVPETSGGGTRWCEPAEETRGRTAQNTSTRPVDAATLADEYDMSLERNSPNQTSNNMQRLDKLFHRTVTGVFNSLKTAVGAEEQAPPHAQQWAYVHTNNELSVCVVAARVAWARRARGVEAALDSLSLQPPAHPAPPPEDLEEWLCARGRAWAASSALGGALRSHVAQRLATVLLADASESVLSWWLQGCAAELRARVFALFSRAQAGAALATRGRRPLDRDLTCQLIMDTIPSATILFGSDTVRSCVSLSVRSATDAALKDVVYRSLDVLLLHFKRAAKLRSPAFDN